VGVRVKDGVVLGLEKLIQSKLLVPKSNRRIQSADKHIGLAISGLVADTRALVNRAREEAVSYRQSYKEAITGKMMAERLGLFVHAYTLHSSVRPFGATTLLGVMDNFHGPQLYIIEPSGVYYIFNINTIINHYMILSLSQSKYVFIHSESLSHSYSFT
jgi:20S proteasome subunit alpha 7